MPWETRARGRQYYIRVKRVRGRLIRKYFGGGIRGQRAAAEDLERRAQRHAMAEAHRAERAQRRATDERVRELFELTKLLSDAALVAVGFAQHDRGEWRASMNPTSAKPNAKHQGGASKVATPNCTEAVRKLLERAHAGDASVLPQLRTLLNEQPELWRRHGDLAQHVQTTLLGAATGRSLWAKEAIKRHMDELTSALSGESPSPLEKVLIERIVLTWAMCHVADLDAIQADKSGSTQAAYYQRRQSAAQTRYLQAIRQLAVVRRLMIRAPSPLELLRTPVQERPEPAAGKRGRAGNRALQTIN
jgi:hypothetical protein